MPAITNNLIGIALFGCGGVTVGLGTEGITEGTGFTGWLRGAFWEEKISAAIKFMI